MNTLELLLGSTASDRVEPVLSCPSVFWFDQAMVRFCRTRLPTLPSFGSVSAWNGLDPIPPLSSRTTTRSAVRVQAGVQGPDVLVQEKNAAYTVWSFAMVGRMEGPSLCGD